MFRPARQVSPRHQSCAGLESSISHNRRRPPEASQIRKAVESTTLGDFQRTDGQSCARRLHLAMQQMNNAGCEPHRRRQESACARLQALLRRAQTARAELAGEATLEERQPGLDYALPRRRLAEEGAPAHIGATPLRRLGGQCARWYTRPEYCLPRHMGRVAMDRRCAQPAIATANRYCPAKEEG